MPRCDRPIVTPSTKYLMSTLEGLEFRYDPDNKPPEWAYVTNELGEQVYIYATHDIFLAPLQETVDATHQA